MAYIGNTPEFQVFTAGTDYFNGDSSTVAFTLSREVNSVNDIEVTVNNVQQRPLDSYTVSGNTLTLTAAPTTGTNNIYVRYLTTTTQVIIPSEDSILTSMIKDNAITSDKIAPGTVIASDVADGSITPAKLQTGVDFTINGLTVGKGAGNIGNNTALGEGALYSNVTGGWDTAVGFQALYYNTANDNTALGWQAGFNNTTGSLNTFIGRAASLLNTAGSYNSSLGYQALRANTTGGTNTALGTQALYSNTTASNNTAVGYQAGFSNTIGASNVALGYQALYYNTAGFNTAIGFESGKGYSTGDYNVSIGFESGPQNVIDASGYRNVFIGSQVGASITTGYANVGIGYQSLLANSDTFNNTAVGYQTLASNIASNNTALGYRASYKNTSGTDNVALGRLALEDNLTGNYNVAIGPAALGDNTAANNVAVGYLALFTNTSGTPNTAIGTEALRLNTTGNNNVAVGFESLYSNTTANSNTAVGYQALYDNTIGTFNIALGFQALQNNTSGNANIAIGANALDTNIIGTFNTAIGRSALGASTANYNIGLGWGAGQTLTTGSNNIIIGYLAEPSSVTVSNEITLGNANVTDFRIPGVGFYIDGGNVGIGTSSPSASYGKLTVAGGITIADDNNAKLQIGRYSAGAPNSYIKMGSNSNSIRFTNPADTVDLVTITSSGSVGIGTNGPLGPLHIKNTNDGTSVSGNVPSLIFNHQSGTYTAGNYYNSIAFARPNSNGGTVGAFVSPVIAGSSSVHLAFGTDAGAGVSERMRITSSGVFMVGTTTTDPTFNRVNGINITPTGVLNSRANAAWDLGRDVTSGLHIAFYTDNGSSRVTGGSISTNGSTTSFNTTSDYRLKENITTLSNALETINQLKPVKWTWKDGFGGTQTNGQGFIAHELQTVIPESVIGEKDAVDKNGNPVYQGVDTSFLVATLVKAIQEQQEQIKALQTEINVLKGE